MKKLSRMPHEQSIRDTDPGAGPEHDGLPATDGLDVEGHRVSRFLPGMPGTGGDNILPGTGGDQVRQVIDDGDDVEGHLMGRTKGERLNPGMPGTGGD